MGENIAQDEFEVRFVRTPERYAVGVRVKATTEDWSEQVMLTTGQVDAFIEALQVARNRSRRAAMRELARAEGGHDEQLEAFLDDAVPLDDDSD